MGKKDPRIDAYIAKSAPFAKPIMKHLRAIVREACPDVEETLKWSMPAFVYHGNLCGFAAFKAHATFGFWKGSLIVDDTGKSLDAMGQFGRITSLAELPPKKVLVGYVRKAMQLNEAGVKLKPRKHAPKKPLAMPADLKTALAKNKKALATFEGFPPSQRREYIEWITESKQAETRARRLKQAIEWMAQGKIRHWKYATRPAGAA